MSNIIICGAPRAGTTSLYRYLSSHPKLAISRKKEMNYFLGGEWRRDNFEYVNVNKCDYENLFLNLEKGLHTLEASPVYMHPWVSRKVAARLQKILPEAKLIFLLRDPINRFFSQYMVDKIRTVSSCSNMTFSDYILMCFERMKARTIGDGEIPDFVSFEIGWYSKILSDYLFYFDKNNIHVIFTEFLEFDPSTEMKKLCCFLGIDANFYDAYIFEAENKNLTPRNSVLYRFALIINSFLEPLLNRYPKIRSWFRNIHDSVNLKKENNQEREISCDLRVSVEQYFEEKNIELVNLLNSVWGISKIPVWLQHAKHKKQLK